MATENTAVQLLLQKTRNFLATRQQAYNQVFDPQNIFTGKVLKDLAKFCRAHETSFHPDPRVHAIMEGRREVWLRIQQQLQLTDEQLWELYGKKEIK